MSVTNELRSNLASSSRLDWSGAWEKNFAILMISLLSFCSKLPHPRSSRGSCASNRRIPVYSPGRFANRCSRSVCAILSPSPASRPSTGCCATPEPPPMPTSPPCTTATDRRRRESSARTTTNNRLVHQVIMTQNLIAFCFHPTC